MIPLLLLLIATGYSAFGSEITGIWMGDMPGRHAENGERENVAFQFKKVNNSLTGVMFGEEFDLPVENLKVDGDQICFTVTSTNYYSGSRVTTSYTGTVAGTVIQLTRERREPAPDPPPKDHEDAKPTLILKRVTS